MFFKGKYKWLSNMDIFPKPVLVNDIEFTSSEAIYQSFKTSSIRERKKIALMNPYEAKKYSKDIKLPDNWDKIKLDVMDTALEHKFSLFHYRLLLLTLEETNIVEDNKHRDKFWGKYNDEGENHLGIKLSALKKRFHLEESVKSKITYKDITTKESISKFKSKDTPYDYICFNVANVKDEYNALELNNDETVMFKDNFLDLNKRLGSLIKSDYFGYVLDKDSRILAVQTLTDNKLINRNNLVRDSIKSLYEFAKINKDKTIAYIVPNVNDYFLLGNLSTLPDNVKFYSINFNLHYTGIGSRNLPNDIKDLILKISTKLESKGYVLRSGGAEGSDTAFESLVADNKEIYLPWKGFNNNTSELFNQNEKAEKIACLNHPVYEKLRRPIQKLMARNVYQILGKDLETPSEFVICYTKDGCKSHLTRTSKTGGTGLAISLASRMDIPVYNLANQEDKELICKWLNIG